MSIIESENLRHLYNATTAAANDATPEDEHATFRFWLNYICEQFAVGNYCLDCSASTYDARPAKSNVVRRLNKTDGPSPVVLWMECQQPGDTVADVERKALSSAKRCTASDDTYYLCVATTCGVCFRVWVYDCDMGRLIPLYDDGVEGDGAKYIRADSENACVLTAFCDMVKEPRPLLRPDLVPRASDLAEFIDALRREDGLGSMDPA